MAALALTALAMSRNASKALPKGNVKLLPRWTCWEEVEIGVMLPALRTTDQTLWCDGVLGLRTPGDVWDAMLVVFEAGILPAQMTPPAKGILNDGSRSLPCLVAGSTNGATSRFLARQWCEGSDNWQLDNEQQLRFSPDHQKAIPADTVVLQSADPSSYKPWHARPQAGSEGMQDRHATHQIHARHKPCHSQPNVKGHFQGCTSSVQP